MTPKRKQRLKIVAFILFAVAGAVALLFMALGNNMNHYYELSVIQTDNTLIGKTIRVGGMVEKGSIQRQENSLKVTFSLTNFKESISVQYEGILPDLFKEGQGVLAKGKLIDKQHFIAEEILAKHDENYMPKEVQDELEKSGYYQHAEGDKKP